MIGLETVRRIAGFQGDGLPVVSLYVNIPPQREQRDSVHARTHDLLARARQVAEDEAVPREVRLSVREDVARLDSEAVQGEWQPPGVALFSCSARDFYETVPLPRSTRERAVLDEDAWIRPLVAILDEDHPTCVVVVDRKSAQIWQLRQDELVEKRKIQDKALRARNYAGWYGLEERRVTNKGDELAKRHFLEVGRVLEQLLGSDGFELVAVGGHDEDVPVFLEFLPRQVRARVAGTFSIDPGTATRGDIRQKGREIVGRYEREDEQRRVADVLERAASRRPAALGLHDCLWAASFAAVQDLLVQADAMVPGVVCPRCGWLDEAGTSCPFDGTQTRETSDVLDELVETVLDDSGSVEHVQAETALRTHVVVAALRFPLPPEP